MLLHVTEGTLVHERHPSHIVTTPARSRDCRSFFDLDTLLAIDLLLWLRRGLLAFLGTLRLASLALIVIAVLLLLALATTRSGFLWGDGAAEGVNVELGGHLVADLFVSLPGNC